MLTWLEINKQSLRHNLEQFKSLAKQSDIWPVIKSNAYGHGIKEVAQILDQDKNATGSMVASLSEALSIKDLTAKPIMVLSYFDRAEESLKQALDRQISLPVYDLNTVDYLDKLASKFNNKFIINIKIDTGTSRLGFRVEEASKAIDLVKTKKNLEIFSVFTHFADSEAQDLSFCQEQLKQLQSISDQHKDLKYHAACSAASISLLDSQLSIVRLGLSLYGLWPSEATRARAQGIEIKPVMSWKTKIVQLKDIKAGQTIGYNRTYKCSKDCQLAVLPVGYNEGYDRLLSNRSQVQIKGKLYPVRGNICMNLMMVELPQASHLKVGETVTLLGSGINAEALAEHAQTINYEIVTRINPLLPRIII